jgi:hypothetical protein
LPPIIVLTDEAITQLIEWVVNLCSTTAEMQSVASQPRNLNKSLQAALRRMGELYAYCVKLMVRPDTPTLAAPHPIDAATDARKAAAQLKLSIRQWQESADVVAVNTFFENSNWAVEDVGVGNEALL